MTLRFTAKDLTRAVKAVEAAGLTVAEAVILPDGTIRIVSVHAKHEPINPADLVDI